MIVIYGPAPQVVGTRNGWTRRIAAIDSLFADQERVYVWPERQAQRGDPHDYRILRRQAAPGVEFVLLDLRFSNQHRELARLIDEADLVYAHTSHSAQHLLPYYRSGKIVTDLHGIAPEEELLQGHPNRSRFYAELEPMMVHGSALLVGVSEAMIDHLRRKHPGLSTPHLVLPIVDDFGGMRPQGGAGGRPRVIYSGSLQQWQNVDRMLDAVQQVGPRCEFRFLTEQEDQLRDMLGDRNLSDLVSVASLPPDQLVAAYAEADFGFVLRDDSPVNRVSCPTKLSEYLANGVIPIVDLVAIGDFEQLGYRYVRIGDFLAGRLPAPAEQEQWRRQNRAVYEKLRATFALGAERLRRFQPPADGRARTARRADWMTSLELGSVYPLHGVQLVVHRDGGRAVVPLKDLAGAGVECRIEVSGAGSMRGLELHCRDVALLISPAVVEVEDASGRRHRIACSPPATDRFGNWMFTTPDAAAVATDLAIEVPRWLHCRFEVLLAGPEVAGITPSPANPPPPTRWQRLWRRLSGSGRS